MKISNKARIAILVGAMCAMSYFAVYVARNILGAVSPQMLEAGFTEERIGAISSAFFVVYAIGQLINGMIGERIKARYMISLGLIFAGICNIIFPFVVTNDVAPIIVYGAMGFFLAMVYAPMTKLVAENVDPTYVPRCSVGYDLASLLGSPMAGLLASIFFMYVAFFVGGGALLLMGTVVFICFLVLERKGIIKYGQYERPQKGKAKLKLLLKHRIIKFSLISIITGVVRTSVVFWLPTYISQHLGFSAQSSAAIFSAATIVMSSTTIIAVFVYERLKSMDKTIHIMFCIAAVAFFATWIVKKPVVNIVCLIIAIMGSGCSSSMMWCRYCPSLRDTGMVSSAVGFLDFLSYMAAATANLIFANAVSSIGWGNIILIWFALMVVGIIVSLPYGAFKNRKSMKKSIDE